MNYNRPIVILCLLIIARRQSRRNPDGDKRASSGGASSDTNSRTNANTEKEEKEPEFVILVGTDRHSGAMTIPLTYYDAALRGCADRLRARSAAGVDVAQRDMSRGEAIEKAKSEHEDLRGPAQPEVRHDGAVV